MAFDLIKLFKDVFDPQKGEVVTVLTDVPHGSIADDEKWEDRRKMAEEWRSTIAKNADKWGIIVNPLVTYKATGAHNADLPAKFIMSGEEIDKETLFDGTNIVISFSQFSATAPLSEASKKRDNFRVASMPTVERRMEKSGLSADYEKIAKVCAKIKPLVDDAVGGDVEFSTGQKCYFDLRFTVSHIDDGNLRPSRLKKGEACISNLPAGEVYKSPYEGWKEGEPSRTNGEIPAKYGDELVVYVVKENMIVDVKGEGPQVKKWKEYFEEDPARGNIAEFAFGTNEQAVVTGNVLEDEKAGFHLAYGRSEHIGGKWGPDKFKSPKTVIHQDIVYSPKSPIVASKVVLHYEDGTQKNIMIDGKLVI